MTITDLLKDCLTREWGIRDAINRASNLGIGLVHDSVVLPYSKADAEVTVRLAEAFLNLGNDFKKTLPTDIEIGHRWPIPG